MTFSSWISVGLVVIVCVVLIFVLERSKWRKNLEAISAFGLLVIAIIGVVFLSSEQADRKADRIQRAWTLLSNVSEFREPGGPDGKVIRRRASVGNVGQIDALESLLADGVSLDGVYLSQFYLERIELPNADLRNANLDAARFQGAELTGVDFTNANLSGAEFGGANLAGAVFARADLTNAKLASAKNLEQSQIADACYRSQTGQEPGVPPTLPEGLKPPPACDA